MTVLFGDFTDILGAVVPGFVDIRPKEMRPARRGTGVIVDKTVRVPLVNGAFRTGEIDPGVIIVTLHSGTGHGRVHESWEVHLPETGEMNLRDHVADRVKYSPEVVGQAQAAATTAARYAGVAQSAAENAAATESRVDAVVSNGVGVLKQHIATEIDAARAAREGAETALASTEGALKGAREAHAATVEVQGTVAGYSAATAEQVTVAKGHADRAEAAAGSAAVDVRAELAGLVDEASGHAEKAGEHADQADGHARNAGRSAAAAAKSAAEAGDTVVVVSSDRKAAEAARDDARDARAATEEARDGARDARVAAEQARDDARAAATSLEEGAPPEGWGRSTLAADVRDSLARADAAITSVPRATATVPGGVKLAGDLAGTWDAPTVPGLARKMDAMTVSDGVVTSSLVKRTNMGRVKTARPDADEDAATKKYVDDGLAAKADATALDDLAPKTWLTKYAEASAVTQLQETVKALEARVAALESTAVKSSVVRTIAKGTGTNSSTLYIEGV